LADVEYMLDRFPSLTIAYIAERPPPPGSARSDPIFYSCFIDGTCPSDHRGRRKPKFTVALPGHPILGNGKSDNQNHAIVFSRGTIIQAIDANQDGYLEESLKLCCALREFEEIPGAGAPPAIVGFREYIFSGLGALGAFGASSEMVFGGLAQRTMADILKSRYHYVRTRSKPMRAPMRQRTACRSSSPSAPHSRPSCAPACHPTNPYHPSPRAFEHHSGRATPT
jgi:1,3-beta-glucan synthase